MRVFRFNNKVYGFASEQAAAWFAASPIDYLADIEELGLEHPKLVSLLGLNSTLPKVSVQMFFCWEVSLGGKLRQ